MSKFTTLLAQNKFLMADGATGTSLFDMGLQSGESPEFWNTTHTDRITALYRHAVDAGSDLFLTNSFGGNSARLKLHQAQDRVYELNFAAAKLGREVADTAPRPIIVAGSIGPTGEIMGAIGTMTHEAAVSIFYEQAKSLLEGGVDLLWLETISAAEEYLAAAEAFAMLDAPWAGTMSFDSAGYTMMGLAPEAFVALLKEIPNPPLAFGANCGVGASDLLRTVQSFAHARALLGVPIPIIAKGNAGIPRYVEGEIHYDGSPEIMGRYAVMARDLGASIIGGCCGTKPAHLEAMRTALDQTPQSSTPPTLAEIEAALGSLTPLAKGKDGAKNTRNSRRRQQ